MSLRGRLAELKRSSIKSHEDECVAPSSLKLKKVLIADFAATEEHPTQGRSKVRRVPRRRSTLIFWKKDSAALLLTVSHTLTRSLCPNFRFCVEAWLSSSRDGPALEKN